MDLSHEIRFSLPVELPRARAVSFVRDVPRSLRMADFLAELQVIADLIHRAKRGAGAMVLVEASAGLGKSVLLDHAAAARPARLRPAAGRRG